MEIDDVYARVKNAIEELIEKDSFLIEVDANERSISHKLAVYLEEQFGEWDVDCEYNRVGEEHVKKVIEFEEIERCYADRKVDSNEVAVFPDIIVHERGKPNNLVVIEVKKSGNGMGAQCDLLKLGKYKEQLGYRFPLFVEFDARLGKSTYRVLDEQGQEVRLG